MDNDSKRFVEICRDFGEVLLMIILFIVICGFMMDDIIIGYIGIVACIIVTIAILGLILYANLKKNSSKKTK